MKLLPIGSLPHTALEFRSLNDAHGVWIEARKAEMASVYGVGGVL